MKLMKKFSIVLTCSLLSFSPLASYADTPNPINEIVFFGDSLTDNGNFFHYTHGLMPTPPYLEGRFTNGRTWAEKVADYYSTNKNITSVNYAAGGETAVAHPLQRGFYPFHLNLSVNDYLLRNVFADKSHTLFVIWIGSNDYLPLTTFDEQNVNNVIDSIRAAINNLIGVQGTNFLIINLPNLASTPEGHARNAEEAQLFTDYNVSNNAKLAALVADIKQSNSNVNIKLFEVDKLLNDFVEHPETFNRKYNVNVTDVSTSCWAGGYSLAMIPQKAMIRRDFENKLQKLGDPKLMDANNLAEMIANSPDLAEAYKVVKKNEVGVVACNNPDEHLFWDSIHPSAVTHDILAQNFIEFINAQYPVG